jgi:hypothetical protein
VALAKNSTCCEFHSMHFPSCLDNQSEPCSSQCSQSTSYILLILEKLLYIHDRLFSAKVYSFENVCFQESFILLSERDVLFLVVLVRIQILLAFLRYNFPVLVYSQLQQIGCLRLDVCVSSFVTLN